MRQGGFFEKHEKLKQKNIMTEQGKKVIEIVIRVLKAVLAALSDAFGNNSK